MLLLFLTLVALGVTVVLRQSRKQEQADTKAGEDDKEKTKKVSGGKRKRPVFWTSLGVILLLIAGFLVGAFIGPPDIPVESTSDYLHEENLPAKIDDVQAFTIYRRTSGAGPINPEDTANAQHIVEMPVPDSEFAGQKLGLKFGSCKEQFHYRFKWKNTGKWESTSHVAEAGEVVTAPTQAAKVQFWHEMSDTDKPSSLVKAKKFVLSRSKQVTQR